MPSTTQTGSPTRSQRPRVLLIGLNYAPEKSGIAPYSAAMARGLVQRGYDVRVLTTKPHYPEWRVPEEYVGGVMHQDVDGVPVTRLPHHVPSDPTGISRLWSEISFGLRALVAPWHRPDIVVFVSPALFSTAIAMLRVRLSRRMRSIVWIQDLYGLGVVETGVSGAGGAVARVITSTERSVVHAADAVTVIHDRFASSVEGLGATHDRVCVIRNWSHLDLHTVGDPEAARMRLGWRDDELIALHTGNIGVKQDLGNLLAAARIAERDDRPVRFVIMGNGSQRPALQHEAEHEHLGRVDFLDAVPGDEYLGALAAADVLLVNEAEGLRDMAVPSKLTSYFAAGRPVVAATDARSITAAEVSSAGAGVQVDPARPQMLLDAVEAVASDPAHSAQLGANGRAYRERVLSERAALDAFEALLMRLAPARRLRARSDDSTPPGSRRRRRHRRWAIVSS